MDRHPSDFLNAENVTALISIRNADLPMLCLPPIKLGGARNQLYDIFKTAAVYIQSLQSMDTLGRFRLVHGNLATIAHNQAVNHAWLEEIDFVYDVSEGHKRLFLKHDYYLSNTITNIRTYTVRQARKLIASHGSWGPW